jgi:hypothetical protein
MTKMTRSLSLVTAAASVLALSACTMQQTDEGKETSNPSESVESTGQALGEFDSRDTLLAALGSATLDCRGTVNPNTYRVDDKTGQLTRNFSGCNLAGGDLKTIDALLGVVNSKEGQNDKLSEHYAKTWQNYQANFPKEIWACPTWKRDKVINPPTWDNVKAQAGQVSKENYVYSVSEFKQCQGNSSCVVQHALACAGGFGSQFLISGDPKGSTVAVDPAWWLTTYDFVDDASNPFMMPGYYHAMSYYGALPGSLYGTIQRGGEACSQWDEKAGKHYIDRALVEIDCGGGWMCMTYCTMAPWSQPAY